MSSGRLVVLWTVACPAQSMGTEDELTLCAPVKGDPLEKVLSDGEVLERLVRQVSGRRRRENVVHSEVNPMRGRHRTRRHCGDETTL